MHQSESVLDCYRKTASAYAEAFFDELAHKPFDRMVLKRFAEENRDRGLVADLGCGPGQTTQFLAGAGLTQLLGIDLSPELIAIARQQAGDSLKFEVGNMMELAYPAEAFGGVVAFYAIVHFSPEELALALREVYRVLRPGGQFLFSFHALTDGAERAIHHRDEFLGQPVSVDFYFFAVDPVLDRAREIGFTVVDAVIRYPYAGYEYPSQRAYLLLEKPEGRG